MKFLIIDPRRQQIKTVDVGTKTAVQLAGLNSRETDHGTIRRPGESHGLGIIVDENSLYVPAAEQSYFAISGRLYAGAAVVFAFDDSGATVDMAAPPSVTWLRTADEVEAAIALGRIERPHVAMEGRTYWEWPQPKVDLTELAERMAALKGTTIIDGDLVLTVKEPSKQ